MGILDDWMEPSPGPQHNVALAEMGLPYVEDPDNIVWMHLWSILDHNGSVELPTREPREMAALARQALDKHGVPRDQWEGLPAMAMPAIIVLNALLEDDKSANRVIHRISSTTPTPWTYVPRRYPEALLTSREGWGPRESGRNYMMNMRVDEILLNIVLFELQNRPMSAESRTSIASRMGSRMAAKDHRRAALREHVISSGGRTHWLIDTYENDYHAPYDDRCPGDVEALGDALAAKELDCLKLAHMYLVALLDTKRSMGEKTAQAIAHYFRTADDEGLDGFMDSLSFSDLYSGLEPWERMAHPVFGPLCPNGHLDAAAIRVGLGTIMAPPESSTVGILL